MYLDTDAFVLRAVKTLKGRMMILLFTEKYGKISAGAFQRGNKKNVESALRPFAFGFFELRKHLGTLNINKTDIKNSYFSIGEHVERFANASFILEFTDKILPEEAPSQELFVLLADFMRLISKRKRGFDTLVPAYMLKSMKIWGVAPELDTCSSCGGVDVNPSTFSVRHGGILCNNCTTPNENNDKLLQDELIYMVNFDIVKIMKYLLENPLTHFENLILNESTAKKLRRILKEYAMYHLDISRLKTECFEGPAVIDPLLYTLKD